MLTVLADAGGSAKGAPITDVLLASAVATVLSAAVLWVAVAHRRGRISWLRRVAEAFEKATGLPGWSILPNAITGGSLLIAVVGFYWDVAKHIDTGRDAGPFGTVAHYPILIGLAGITLGGFLAIVLGAPKDVPTSVRLRGDWRAPLGGILVFTCGALALTGFPLDDVWHTLFGQDVTLWGPTHILMVGGASLSTLGLWVLLVEGKHASRGAPPAWVTRQRKQRTGLLSRLERLGVGDVVGWGLRVLPDFFLLLGEALIAGGFLIGLSTLQGEFDFGVPQFQLVYQPIMIAFAAGAGLVAARIKVGRGAAIVAALFNCLVFGLMSLYIGPGLGLSTLHFPLYLAEAAIVEAVALALAPGRSPVLFGVAAGLLVGTVGVAAEWAWSHLWMPLPWPSSMLGQTAALAPAAGMAGGVIGAYVGRALNAGQAGPVEARTPRWLFPAAAAVAVFCIAYPLPMTAGARATATASLTQTSTPSGARAVEGTFTITPASAAAGAQWVQVTDWQGGGLVVDRLRRVSPGVYRTTEPIPVGGKWKAVLRVAGGRSLRGVPVYLPEDRAIPAKGLPASSYFTRPFEREKKILQREAVGGPPGMATVAYVLLLAIVCGWMAAMVWGMRRLQGAARSVPARRMPPPRVATA